MPSKRLITWFGLAVLAVALVVGFIEVLEKRFAEGGIYPHYASYRTDPLGTSAFYESLEQIEGNRVSRNLTHLNSIEGLDDSTVLFLLGYSRENLPDLRSGIDSPVLKAVKEGARMVVTVNPGLVPEKFQPARSDEEEDWFERRRKLREDRIRSERREERDEDEEAKEEEKASEDSDEEDLEKEISETLGKRLYDLLEFDLESLEDFERPEGGWEVIAKRKSPVKAMPNWYSQYRWVSNSKAWNIIATSEGKPVAIERRYGKGTVAFMSDSFFVSNEALHLEPVPEFLYWMLGGKTNIIFDETIHGSVESGGAMKLMRRYRVHGIFFGLFLFVGLWAWRSSSPLAPGDDDLDRGLIGAGTSVSGEETGSGLIRLLRRSIEPKALIRQCLEIWKESRHAALPEKLEQEIQKKISAHERDPKANDAVSTYRSIVESVRRN